MANDPTRPVRFSFDGRTVSAHAGQSVAGALFAAGVTTLTRSAKYRRPRGIHCAGGYCPNCLLRVDGRPHVRACMTVPREGMRVETEGSVGSRVDPLRAIDRAGRLFPVGFQYRYFKRQGRLWRLWEGMLRRAAAESEMPEPVTLPGAEYLRADVLVVGAGPAGVAAAAEVASRGATVILASRRARLGAGVHPALDGAAAPDLRAALRALSQAPNATVVSPGTVVAGFGDTYLVDAETAMLEVTAPASILASGAYERALVFPGNDLPGVMLTTALRRLALEEGALRSASAVLVANDDSAYATASKLIEAGVDVRALLDCRAEPPRNHCAGLEVHHGVQDVRARGRGCVRRLTFSADGRTRSVRCEIVGMSGGWQPADELRYVATSTGQIVVEGEGATALRSAKSGEAMPVLQSVGGVAGTRATAEAVAEGRRAGRWAVGAADA